VHVGEPSATEAVTMTHASAAALLVFAMRSGFGHRGASLISMETFIVRLGAPAMLRYLPKYSPDLNPFEMPYSKFKTFLRRVAARTVRGLNRAIRFFIPQLGPQECANYFKHAGYKNTPPI
jgi:hypothetical protein